MQAAAKVIAGSVSQWSLTFEVRKSALQEAKKELDKAVAMEPDL